LSYNGSLNRTAGLASLSLYALSRILAKGSNTARVKAPTYDGTSSWFDYKSHFDACSRINQWSENEKGLYLAVALRGQAQGILGYLPIDKQQDYKSLAKALEERFA
jgi:predicted HTH domain antitoxin